jgi:type I restriction enzyme M protein
VAKASAQRNLFCRRSDLGNEASVEQFFVNRLLADLGYEDRHIKPKTSLQELHVNLGRRRLLYRPDYAMEVGGTLRWIVDAKATDESLDDHVGQCAGYCLALNRAYRGENPVRYFLITNGLRTRLYAWDAEDPIVEIDFPQFTASGRKYRRLRELVAPATFSAEDKVARAGELFTLTREPIEEVNAAFSWCHQLIYKKDNLSQAAAFGEFVKLVFLKLLSDRQVHEEHPEFAGDTSVEIPADSVKFSVRWIEEREQDHPNPLDALQFQTLLQGLEAEIQNGTRKRVFDADEHIDLSPETIKSVVRRLEHIDLFGIDADLNGRLFETFLNATMRGKDLGQYFTSRSVVKLGVRLAQLRADREHVDSVIDACCGTGGFLIDVLADMWAKVDANNSLSDREAQHLKKRIATECVVGIDVARDPPLARIARVNMYLHGDGGSSIYQTDALDKQLRKPSAASAELDRETRELRERFQSELFDVALTNPPFAKEYERNEKREAQILDEYDLGFSTDGGSRRRRPRLRSSMMFLERYHDLLRPGGRLITVIDDSVLGAPSYAWVRDYLRERFLVRAVISLPGDAFQRSKARVKTSLIVLEKKRDPKEAQPPIFMYYTTAVGVDDPPRQRTLPVDRINRLRAADEIDEAGSLFEAFLNGDSRADAWTVPADRIAGRMDVKGCLPAAERKVPTWRRRKLAVTRLSDVVNVLYPRPEQERVAAELPDGGADPNLVATADSDELVTHLRVRYDGFAEPGEAISASDSTYPVLYRVSKDDLVLSHINAIHGAICIVPEACEGMVVTSEYTVCRAKSGIDPRLVWLLLRSPEIRSDLLLNSTGIGRSRVRWATASDVALPEPPSAVAREVAQNIKKAEKKEQEARELRDKAQERLTKALSLDSKEAQRILAAFKPPR